jgi:hypothetical protein
MSLFEIKNKQGPNKTKDDEVQSKMERWIQIT